MREPPKGMLGLKLEWLQSVTHQASLHLVGGWTNPSEKYAQVKLNHLGVKNGENKKYLKPRLVMDFRSLFFSPSFHTHLRQLIWTTWMSWTTG